MQEEDIPLLTAVHTPSAQPIRSFSITADFVAEILVHIKPQLNQMVMESIRTTIESTQQLAMDNCAAFSDKTKADLATEIPKMMLMNAEIIKADLAKSLSQMQAQAVANAQTEFNVSLDALQLKFKQQLEMELVGISDNAKNDFKQSLNAELPTVEQALANKVHEILDAELPHIEQKLSLNIKTEIEKLIDSVRLIFSQ